MRPVRLAAVLGSLFLGVLLHAPGALGHVTYESDDGAYFITVGQQGEPVYTFKLTNLDLIITENDNGERGAEVEGVHETLTAVLIGPGGEELSHPLAPQRGQVGRYQFEEPYTLTQPGVYTLRLQGTIRDTPVDDVYDLPHAIESQSGVMFPDAGISDLGAANERIAALESQVQELQSRLQAQSGGSTEAPAPGLALLAVLGLGLVLLVRRRSGH